MVCEVCGVDRSDESGELVILDYPRFMAADCPSLNCGSGATGAKTSVLSDLARRAIARREARSVGPPASTMNA